MTTATVCGDARAMSSGDSFCPGDIGEASLFVARFTTAGLAEWADQIGSGAIDCGSYSRDVCPPFPTLDYYNQTAHLALGSNGTIEVFAPGASGVTLFFGSDQSGCHAIPALSTDNPTTAGEFLLQLNSDGSFSSSYEADCTDDPTETVMVAGAGSAPADKATYIAGHCTGATLQDPVGTPNRAFPQGPDFIIKLEEVRPGVFVSETTEVRPDDPRNLGA